MLSEKEKTRPQDVFLKKKKTVGSLMAQDEQQTHERLSENLKPAVDLDTHYYKSSVCKLLDCFICVSSIIIYFMVYT